MVKMATTTPDEAGAVDAVAGMAVVAVAGLPMPPPEPPVGGQVIHQTAGWSFLGQGERAHAPTVATKDRVNTFPADGSELDDGAAAP